ncbi:MAG: DUF4959 domain-containing protein [Prevotella sp.]|nr:DUF4959 domain-containing protein [Prevotella sp.]
MKLRYLLFALMACALWSCSDDEETFESGLTPNAFSFKPVTGGAIMYYQLPDDPEVTGLYVRYNDAFGQPVTRSASTANDSLLLTGFNEAKSNVPAQVYVQRRDRTESTPIPVSFSTEDSGPVAFMKSVQVLSNWEGFTLMYSTPDFSEGLVNVFYLGVDPQTGGPDTVLISSFTLEDATVDETINFKVKQQVDKPTVILRTEDFRGNRISEKSFEGVEFLEQAMMPSSEFDFYCAVAMEEEYEYSGSNYYFHQHIGPDVLFDGDILGAKAIEYNGLSTFVAGPNACGPDPFPMYIDCRKERTIAGVRMYNALYADCTQQDYQWNGSWGHAVMMPCDVTLYAAYDDGDTTPLAEKNMEALDWKRVSFFYQDPDLANAARWCPWTFPNAGWEAGFTTVEEMEAHGPEYMEMVVSAAGQGNGYRYMKIVVNNTFNAAGDPWIAGDCHNDAHMITFTELEVYTKKD